MSSRFLTWAACSLLALTSVPVYAVSYASGVRNTGGTSYQFVLNADASNVVIRREGAADIQLGPREAGRIDFDLGAATAFDIEVSSTNARWDEIGDTSNPFVWFERPNGVAVNSDPASPYFGTIYVANATEFDVTIPGTRAMGDGIYALTADGAGLNPATFAEITDPDDTSAAFAPAGWTVAGSTFSPWGISFDDDSNLIVQDYSGANGGIKYASPDLQTGGLVLAFEGGPAGGVVEDSGGNFVISNHGSTMSDVTVTGAVGNNLTVWALDQDLGSDSGGVSGIGSFSDGSHLWRWDVGDVTDYADPANLVINGSSIPFAQNGDKNWLDLNNVDVIADAAYSSSADKWYFVQRRANANEAGLLVLTADGVDGNSPTLEFSTLDWTVENGFDGFPGEFDFITSDILKWAAKVELSEDGTELYVIRSNVDSGEFNGVDLTNPLLGGDTNLAGDVLVIPLDENGIPIIEIDEMGTPGDNTDDQISNWESIDAVGFASGSRSNIKLDAAGNLYATTNSNEVLQVFSPGGAKKTTYSNTAALDAGTFTVEDILPVAGDYNGDGLVDAADYTVYRDTLGDSVAVGTGADGNENGVIDTGDYTVWVENFGSAASTSAAVPEPASALLVGLALMALGRRR